MKRNEGTTDRILRAVVAAAALAAATALGLGTIAGIVLVVVAAILGVTAVTGFCPIYRVLGLSTVTSGKADAPRETVPAS